MESMPRARETVTSVKQFTLRFNSRIEPAFSHLRLTGATGEDVSLNTEPLEMAKPNRLTVSVPALGPGLYTVQWRIFTVDGHVTHGSFWFRVGDRR